MVIGERRTTTDLIVLIIVCTICFALLAGGATIAVIEIRNPETDTTKAVNSMRDIINTLLGLVAGFLAGRTTTKLDMWRGEKPVSDDSEGQPMDGPDDPA